MTNLALTYQPEIITLASAQFDRVALEKALARACTIVPKLGRGAAGEPYAYLKRVAPGRVELLATNSDIIFRSEIPADASNGFEAVLNAHDLHKLVKASGATDARITVTKPCEMGKRKDWKDGEEIEISVMLSGRVDIALGDMTFAMECEPRDRWPVPAESFVFKTQAETYVYQINAAEMQDALEFVAEGISTEETRYYLNGVFLQHVAPDAINGLSGLCAVATDGHRLYMRSIPALVPIGIPAVIVPRVTVLALLKFMGRKPSGAVKVTVDQTYIRFSFNGLVMTSKLIDGTFPDYARVVPRNIFGGVVTMQGKALAAALKQVNAANREKSRCNAFEFQGGKVTIRMNNPDAGAASLTLSGVVMPDEFQLTAGFNGRYLAALCDAFPGEITFQMADPQCPAVFSSPDYPRGFAVLMPMRV